MSPIHGVFRVAAFVSLSAGLLSIYEVNRLVVPERRRELLAERYCTQLVDWILGIFGTKLSVHGKVAYDTGALVVANHQSVLDVAVMLSVFKPVMVSRHDVADWPLFGRMARHGSTIFVDRDDGHSGAAAVRAIRRELRNGRTVGAFPEGATFPADTVHDFHPGAFAAVRALDVPIVPAGLAYSPVTHYGRDSFPRHLGKIASRPVTRISLHIGEPIDALRDPRQTAIAARERVQELVYESRKELDGR